jgi:hypothetical protein
MTPFSILAGNETRLWPAHFTVDPMHAADVLAGSYDIPFNPEKPPVILDIGANIGAFTSWAAKRWPGCVIHAYEPHPGNYAMLEETRWRSWGRIVSPTPSPSPTAAARPR